MTHREIRVLGDGTHWYKCGHGYRPLSESERKYAVRKPDDPRAVRWGGEWLLPLDLLPDEARVMPETRPDEETLDHWAGCRCEVCRRPEATILWRRRHRRMARLRRESSRRAASGTRPSQALPQDG